MIEHPIFDGCQFVVNLCNYSGGATLPGRGGRRLVIENIRRLFLEGWRYNAKLIAIRRLQGADDEELRQLITTHLKKTGSQRTQTILDDWETQRQLFWDVAPRENVVAIESATAGSGSVEAEEEKVTA